MKRSIIISMIAAMFFTACSEKETTTILENVKQTVTVNVTGFTTSFEDMKTGTSLADCDYANVASLAIFNGEGEMVYSANQLRTEYTDNLDEYGSFSFPLNVGTYKMVVIVTRDNAAPTIASSTDATLATAGKETFAHTQDIVVSTSGENTFNAVLNRIITKLRIHATDVVPSNAKSITLTLGKGSNDHFNPVSGLSADNDGFSFTMDITAYRGQSNIELNSNFFLPADEQNVAVSYVFKGSNDEVLISKDLGQVPFKRNRISILTGRVFSEQENASLTLNTNWLDDYNATF